MQAWEDFIRHLENELGGETINKWVKPLKIVKFDACNLYLEAKDTFQALWFEEHIRPKALTKFQNNNKKRVKIHLAVANAPVQIKKKSVKASVSTPNGEASFSLLFDGTDPHSTYENYSLTENQQLPWKLLSDLACHPEDSTIGLGIFNPIYLYGPPGTGKTHLLTATAKELKDRRLKVIYVKAETFTEHVVSAIRAGEMSQFRHAYRNIDVLLIDDVQVFSRKGATQEELFHTFNTLHTAGKQIILSANCAPGELQLIEPRLVSRFEWGIVIPLQAYTREELKLVLEKKAHALQFKLHPKLNDFLIETFKSSLHSVIKALKALILRTHMHHPEGKIPPAAMSVASARSLLHDLILEEGKKALTVEKILQTVSEHYGIRKEDILGTAQTREYVLPRQIAMHLCRHELKLPFMKIGDHFSKDHSTVMSSVKLVQKGLEQNNVDIISSLESIKKKLKGAYSEFPYLEK
jgi:chromosomal replication initiator protein